MNKLEIFKNERFGEIRVAGTSEEPLFCLADVCKAVGLKNPSSVKIRLDESDLCMSEVGVQTGFKSDGTPAMQVVKMTFINESGFYDVLLQSDAPQVKPFRKWVTSEVLPTIRKTGGYVASTDYFVESYFGNLDDTTKQFLVTTLNDKKQLLEQNKRQQSLIEEQKPKAEFFDEIVDSKDTCDMNTVAKTLNCGIGRNRLFALLRSKGILLSNNQPSQNYIELGWFRIIETKYSLPNGDIKVYFKTVVYQKGIDGIRKLLKNNK